MLFSFMDLMRVMNTGAVSYFTYKSYFMWFRDLPGIPDDYYLPIANIDLNSDDRCKALISGLRIKTGELEKSFPAESEELFNTDYSKGCFLISLHLGQMFDFWYGKLTFIDNKKLEIKYELLLDKFWSCLKKECGYEDLKEYAGNFYHAYLEIAGKDGGKNRKATVLPQIYL